MEIKDFSVILKDYSFRRDMNIISEHSKICEIDREYFSGKIDRIIYKCKCSNDKEIIHIINKNEKFNESIFCREKNIINICEEIKNEDQIIGPFIIKRIK